MVNLQDPAVIAKERDQVHIFWTLVDGIFIWEFLISLDYEWSVIRGSRPFRWTIWIYSFTRMVTLTVVAINIFSLTATPPFNCQVIIELQFIFGYLAFVGSTLLIVLRIIAIWDRNRIIVALAVSIWGGNIAFLIQGAWRFRSSWSWSGETSGCDLNLESVKLSVVSSFVTDVTLLSIMLFGLHRLRRHGCLMGLGRFLWNQGVIWLLIAVVTELLPTLFILLNLNGPLSIMFQIPWFITISISATRVYRSLSDFLSSDTPHKIRPPGDRTALEANSTSTAPIFLTGVQLAVHTTHEQHWTPEANWLGSNIDGQPHGKPCEPIVDIVDDKGKRPISQV